MIVCKYTTLFWNKEYNWKKLGSSEKKIGEEDGQFTIYSLQLMIGWWIRWMINDEWLMVFIEDLSRKNCHDWGQCRRHLSMLQDYLTTSTTNTIFQSSIFNFQSSSPPWKFYWFQRRHWRRFPPTYHYEKPSVSYIVTDGFLHGDQRLLILWPMVSYRVAICFLLGDHYWT